MEINTGKITKIVRRELDVCLYYSDDKFPQSSGYICYISKKRLNFHIESGDRIEVGTTPTNTIVSAKINEEVINF